MGGGGGNSCNSTPPIDFNYVLDIYDYIYFKNGV